MLFDESITTLIGIILTGISGITTYLIQKHIDKKTEKYNFANILHGEVRRMLLNWKTKELSKNLIIESSTHSPITEIYLGLLNSGNIKYFESQDLQDKLDKLYGDLKGPIPDEELAISIMGKLENIKKNNRGYKDKILSFFKNTRTKNFTI